MENISQNETNLNDKKVGLPREQKPIIEESNFEENKVIGETHKRFASQDYKDPNRHIKKI